MLEKVSPHSHDQMMLDGTFRRSFSILFNSTSLKGTVHYSGIFI